MTWTAPANPGSAITDYDVQYRAGTSVTWSDAGHSGTGLTLTLTGLTAGTSYQVQVRATNAEGTGAWSASATGTTTTAANAAPTFTSAASFSVAENTTAVGTVVASDADEDDSITGYALTGGADRSLFAITNAGALTFKSAPDYESPTDADTDNAYVVVVEATSGAGERARTATQTVTVAVTDVDEAAVEGIERVAETVQPEVSRAMVSGTLEVVTQRIEQPRDGQAQASLGGRSSFTELLQSHEAALNGEVELDWRRVLGTSSFSLPLDLPGAGEGLEVWGAWGVAQSLERWQRGGVDVEGRCAECPSGGGLAPAPGVVGGGGVVVCMRGDVDYDDDGAKGTSRSRMTSVHPYLGWFPSEGSSLWMSAGYGRGTVEGGGSGGRGSALGRQRDADGGSRGPGAGAVERGMVGRRDLVAGREGRGVGGAHGDIGQRGDAGR